MGHAKFVHLAVKTAYSLSEGAVPIRDLAALCKADAMPAVAVTDSNNLFGALEFSESMAKRGIQPILGCALAVELGGGMEGRRRGAHPILRPLAQTREGYANLMRLVSDAHLLRDPTEAPHVSLEELAERSEGLILLTGGMPGPLDRYLRDGQGDAASELAERLKSIFGDRLYVELMRHGRADEAGVEDALVDMAFEMDLPLVATNDVHFLGAESYDAHDALLCISAGTYVSETNRPRLTPEHRFKTAAEMAELFTDLPEAIENTLVVAQRCAFKAESHAPILPKFVVEGGESEEDMLRRISHEGLEQRLRRLKDELAADEGDYRDRLGFELEVIIGMGFAGYFLIVADFIQWAKRDGVPVGPGRGSGAGSVVAWALGITGLDPLRFGLLFERFLNPERVSMPDFDIDFCQERRDRVIRYVQEKYGKDQVAQIITFGKLQARAVLRDVGRVLQQPYPVTDRLCKMVPNNPAAPVTLQQAIDGEPRLQQEIDSDPLTAEVVNRALKLEGLYRHASTHAAGVVIGDRPLWDLVPLYRDPRSEMPVTQFNMKWVEKAGLVKFDFLGLKTLTILRRTVELLAKRGVELDIDHIPLDDKDVFELLSRGDTAGVFQLESSGMRAALTGLKPDKFEDIIALVALYRPGPMDNIPTYVNRKHGRETVDYLHNWLQDILQETYGVIIYQEQVMQIAQVLAGYSLGEADLLRRAMGKKIKSEMDAQQQRFVDGAVEKGVDRGRAQFIFELVAKFAGYGFNKSHAAAYAMVAYQTAYCKAHYPVEFMAAVMTLDQHNTDKLAAFRKELDQLGIALLPPDINASGADFEVEVGEAAELAVRYALAAVKNVGGKAMAAIVAERQSNGRFKDLFDFAERIDCRMVNKRQLENLVCAGAFDSLERNRARVFENIETLLRHAHRVAEARQSAQTSLFADAGAPADRPPLAAAEAWSEGDSLTREREAVGFYLSSHPLEAYSDLLAGQNLVSAAEVAESEKYVGHTVKMVGAIDYLKERRSARSGNRYAFFGLSDSSGAFETIVFSDQLESARAATEAGEPVIVGVGVERRNNGEDRISMVLKSIEPIGAAKATHTARLDVTVRSAEAVGDLRDLLTAHTGGNGSLRLTVVSDAGDREVEIALPGRFGVGPALRNAIAAIPGVEEAHLQ